MEKLIPLACLLLLGAAVVHAQDATPPRYVEFRVAPKLADVAESLSLSEVRLTGFLGERIANNATNRLLAVDEAPLLAGFQMRPGSHPWIGEHVGKWMHAAALAYANTGDPALRAKLDRVAAALIAAQEPDGYLGTYEAGKRMGKYQGADWDVWVHKYCLMGLLTYYQYTGNRTALDASRKIGDLLVNTFGPGKKSIIDAGTHVGMAATSVLQPLMLLYRHTGDERYLDFGRYIVTAYNDPGGPRIVETISAQKSVAKTANAKAYEMLSNIVGLCELARATGERSHLEIALTAWQDVIDTQLYITGTASHHEYFHEDFDLPNGVSGNVGETCVSTTWIQLNEELLRLTGEARFADALEQTLYNHLAAAQRPDGAQWCYFTPLDGVKGYGPGINCCVSSGPRGMALAPTIAFSRLKQNGADILSVNLLESGEATAPLGGQRVRVIVESDFPRAGSATLTMHTEAPATFGLRVRSPAWAAPMTLRLPGGREIDQPRDGWLTVPAREWRDGETARLGFTIAPAVIAGEHRNEGWVALEWGPIVLSYDTAHNPETPPQPGIALVHQDGRPPFARAEGDELTFHARVKQIRTGEEHAVTLVPFAAAGADREAYRTWLLAPGARLPANASLFWLGEESRSRAGNVNGFIADGDPGTFVVTFDERRPRRGEDWFAVSLPQPVEVRRVVYRHGSTFHDGGWFDASAAKPRIEARRTPGGEWETIGTLEDYPATTATESRRLRSGQAFTLRLERPARVAAIRVIGAPAHGDNPEQAFSSCAELEAFPE